jgi:hypothetical protein
LQDVATVGRFYRVGEVVDVDDPLAPALVARGQATERILPEPEPVAEAPTVALSEPAPEPVVLSEPEPISEPAPEPELKLRRGKR